MLQCPHNSPRLVFFLCFFLIFGVPGCYRKNIRVISETSILSRGENPSWFSNIGLLQEAAPVTDEIILRQSREPLSPIPHIQEKPPLISQVILGTYHGALAGFEVGQLFCFPGTGSSRSESSTGALIFLIICGGGLVTGASVGAIAGMIMPFFPWLERQGIREKIQTETIIAENQIIQGIWQELLRQDVPPCLSPDTSNGQKSQKGLGVSVKFGDKNEPITAFLKIEPTQLELLPAAEDHQENLTLFWTIRLIYLDLNKKALAMQVVKIHQGEYLFEKWANHDAQFLKEQLREGYQTVVEQIIRELPQLVLQ